MGSRKVKADCRADTRGGPWAGIPVCVIKSAAFRDCSVHARAILIELVARMNGYNNGKIAVSQREFADALRCHARKVVRGIIELWEHGLLDVTVEGKWKERMAREYRLTFVSTKHANATNEYRDWPSPVKSGVATVESENGRFAASVESEAQRIGATLESERRSRSRKTAISQNPPDATVESLISKPCVGPGLSGLWWSADRVIQAWARLALAIAAQASTPPAFRCCITGTTEQ